MTRNVKYDREMRDKATLDGDGLYTLEIIYPSSNGKKPSGGITMQGPMDKEQYRKIYDFMISLMRENNTDAAVPPAIDQVMPDLSGGAN